MLFICVIFLSYFSCLLLCPQFPHVKHLPLNVVCLLWLGQCFYFLFYFYLSLGLNCFSYKFSYIYIHCWSFLELWVDHMSVLHLSQVTLLCSCTLLVSWPKHLSIILWPIWSNWLMMISISVIQSSGYLFQSVSLEKVCFSFSCILPFDICEPNFSFYLFHTRKALPIGRLSIVHFFTMSKAIGPWHTSINSQYAFSFALHSFFFLYLLQ